jgi:hypothetical protein
MTGYEHTTGSGSYVDFTGRQTFVIDPRTQGFGLAEYDFLDAYANKFFILSGSEGAFISPCLISDKLQGYYATLDLDVAASQNVIALEGDARQSSLVQRIGVDPRASELLAAKRGSFLIPYMMTEEAERFAQDYNLAPLQDAARTAQLADKSRFQSRVQTVSQDIEQQTGLDVAIDMRQFLSADRKLASASYAELSQGGRKDLVVVRPRSASALGIFVLRANEGIEGLRAILDGRFGPEEEVLLEEFVPHNHSPSMQGVQTESGYQHLYFGRQVISIDGETVSYDSSQIPFGPETVPINPEALQKMNNIHKILGEELITEGGIQGIAGFDAIASVTSEGELDNFKLTELNLHLPSSVAIYAAMQKVFPSGFTGIAHNVNIPLQPGQSSADFLDEHRAQLIREKDTNGVFPLNTSYEDKVDVIAFAKDANRLNDLLEKLR